jgi:hypothetical protein
VVDASSGCNSIRYDEHRIISLECSLPLYQGVFDAGESCVITVLSLLDTSLR